MLWCLVVDGLWWTLRLREEAYDRSGNSIDDPWLGYVIV